MLKQVYFCNKNNFQLNINVCSCRNTVAEKDLNSFLLNKVFLHNYYQIFLNCILKAMFYFEMIKNILIKLKIGKLNIDEYYFIFFIKVSDALLFHILLLFLFIVIIVIVYLLNSFVLNLFFFLLKHQLQRISSIQLLFLSPKFLQNK